MVVPYGINLFSIRVRGPEDHLQVRCLVRTHRTQHLALLTARTIISERVHSKTCKGKRHMGCHLGKRSTSFQFSSSGHATWAEIPPVMSCDNTCEMFSRQACAIQCPGIGSWPFRQPLPGTYHDSRLPEGKVFSTNHTVHTVWMV